MTVIRDFIPIDGFGLMLQISKKDVPNLICMEVNIFFVNTNSLLKDCMFYAAIM